MQSHKRYNMKKSILQIISFYSDRDYIDFINNNYDAPSHHLWGYDEILNSGFEIKVVPYIKNRILNIIGKKIHITNLSQQINCLLIKNKHDVIYVPFSAQANLLYLLKYLGLFKNPIIAISHGAYNVPFERFLQRLKQKTEKLAYEKGVTMHYFLNEVIYKKYMSLFKFKTKEIYCHSYLNWGVDIRPYNRFIDNCLIPPSNSYIFSAGKSGRDFNTLINGFSGVNFKLYIATVKSFNFDKTLPFENVQIDFSLKDDINVVKYMLPLYYNALAVAIPIESEMNMPTGSTILFEALSMGKPVIITEGSFHPFDVEEEGVGLKVKYKDPYGWNKAINYLISHPDEAKEMGERGRQLCLKRYNYQLFSQQIIKTISAL